LCGLSAPSVDGETTDLGTWAKVYENLGEIVNPERVGPIA
jgi:hypothetical protein